MARLTGWRGVGLACSLAGSALAAPPDGVVIRDIGFKMANVVLPSGMRIVVEEDHSQSLVAIVAVVDVGSAKDPAGKEGLAHMVEHLTFRTKPDGKLQRASSLDFAGAGFWNAFTSHDLTTYVTVGPTEALTQLLSIEGQMLLSPLKGLDARAFEVEQGVVKNELLQSDEQGRVSVVQTGLFGALYPQGHPYHLPVIGTEVSISHLTLADAEAFVREHYIPRNITLYVSGDVDLATIQKVFDASVPLEFLAAPADGPVAPPHRLSQESPPVPKPPEKTQLQTIRAPTETPMLYIAWSLPGGFAGQRHLERFAEALFQRASLRAARWGSDIQGLGTTLIEGRYANTLICTVRLKTGRNPEKTLERVLDQVVRMWMPSDTGSDAVLNSAVDFHWLQNTAVVDVALQTESVGSRAVDKATLIHWTGDAQAWGKELKAIYELRAAKMQAFAYEWLTRDRARALFVEPSGESGPGRDFGGATTVFAAPDQVRAKIATEALTTYVHGPVRDVRQFILKNGLNVFLVRRTSAPTVAVTLGFRGGDATSEPRGVAELATALARPKENRNGPVSRFGGRLVLSTDADSTYYTGRAASGNLENILALLSDSVQTLHVDGAVKGIWDELVSNQRTADALSSSRMARTFREHAYPGSSLGRTAVAADYEKLGAGDLQTWIDRTLRPNGAALAIVGDIDLNDAEKLVRAWFEEWQGAPDTRAEALASPAPAQDGPLQLFRVDRPGFKQTELRLGCSVATPSSTDRIALRLVAARLRSRLGNLARSSLGGSYGFQGGVTPHRRAIGLDVHGAVDGVSLTRVLAVARKELDELSTVKVTDDELGLLKWRQGIASNIRYATNSDLTRGLVSNNLADLPVDFIQKYPELLSAATPEDLTRVAAACRKTAFLLVSGDPEVVASAVQATDR
jgi:zinc protease